MVACLNSICLARFALCDLPEELVTPDVVTALADSAEKDVEGGLAGRSA